MLSGAGRKQKGARRERQLIHYLEENGFCTCHAGGSLGLWDVVAIPVGDRSHKRDVLLVQLKSNRPPGRAERQTLTDFVEPSCCCKMVVVAPDGEKVSDWEAYTSFNVISIGSHETLSHALALLDV